MAVPRHLQFQVVELAHFETLKPHVTQDVHHRTSVVHWAASHQSAHTLGLNWYKKTAGCGDNCLQLPFNYAASCPSTGVFLMVEIHLILQTAGPPRNMRVASSLLGSPQLKAQDQDPLQRPLRRHSPRRAQQTP